MPTARIYKISNTFAATDQGKSLGDLDARSWKFLVPIPAAEGEGLGVPKNLLGFHPSGINHFVNDGDGNISKDNNFSISGGSPDVAKLELGRNACVGKFTDGSVIDFFAQDFSATDDKNLRRFAIWRITRTIAGGITSTQMTKLPLPLISDFPWDPAVSQAQLIAAGNFFDDSPHEDLFFYQGNTRRIGLTGAVQLFRIGFEHTPRQSDFRATWTRAIPCSFSAGSTELLLFDDGYIEGNRLGRGFKTYPSSDPNPTSPWAEMRHATAGGHLVLSNLSVKPDFGPPIKQDGVKGSIINREALALPAPFAFDSLVDDRFKRQDPGGRAEPDNMDWWNDPGRIARCDFYFGAFPGSGRFLQSYFSLDTFSSFYRVLDRNLQIVSPGVDRAFPLSGPGDLVIPASFIKTDPDTELLIFSKP